MVDLKFTDVPGTWQHMTLSVSALEEDAFSDGLGFDGSSIRGFQQISESDMLLMPDASDREDRSLLRRAHAVADLQRDRPDHARGLLARPALRRAEGRAPPRRRAASPTPLTSGRRPSSTSSTTSRSTRKRTRAYYEVDTAEAYWNRGAGFGDPHAKPNVGHHPRSQEGYFPVPPMDTMGDLRALMVLTLEALGVACEFHHHEVGGPGQGEIDLRFQPLLQMADALMMHKYIVKNVARAAGKSATFLPKPIFEENGSGMHVHQSLWKDGADADVRRERLRAAERARAQLRRPACSSTAAP